MIHRSVLVRIGCSNQNERIFSVGSCMKTKLTPCSYDNMTLFEWELSKLSSEQQSQHILLKSAVKSGDIIEVKKCLEQQPRLHSKVGGFILWDAVLNNEIEIASMFVDAGADLNVRRPFDDHNSSFLHELVKNNDPRYHQLAVQMMNRGANVNASDDYSVSVLQRAIQAESSVDIIKELLKHGADVDSSLIVRATDHFNSNELITLLIDKFINVETRSKRIEDLLLHCSCTKYVESKILPVVKILLDENLPIAEIDNNGCTLLGAIHSGKIQMVKLLIDYGFDVNTSASGRVSPLYELSDCELPLHVASTGELPLYAAAVSNKPDIMELLLQAGAKVNAPSSYSIYYKGYAINAACANGSVENIRLLLRHEADVNLVDSRGRTPFSMIKFTGVMTDAHRLVIKHLALLVFKGMTINERDLQIIQNFSEMLLYYTQCLDELRRMKMTKITNDVFFFSIFEKSDRKLSFMIRIDNFVKRYNSVNRKGVFPNYHEDMDFIFDNAKTRRELFSDKEEVLCESLKYDLPIIPLERIIYYLYLNDKE